MLKAETKLSSKRAMKGEVFFARQFPTAYRGRELPNKCMWANVTFGRCESPAFSNDNVRTCSGRRMLRDENFAYRPAVILVTWIVCAKVSTRFAFRRIYETVGGLRQWGKQLIWISSFLNRPVAIPKTGEISSAIAVARNTFNIEAHKVHHELFPTII